MGSQDPRMVSFLARINRLVVNYCCKAIHLRCFLGELTTHLLAQKQSPLMFSTLSSRRSLLYRNQSIDFYMIGTSVIKELNMSHSIPWNHLSFCKVEKEDNFHGTWILLFFLAFGHFLKCQVCLTLFYLLRQYKSLD